MDELQIKITFEIANEILWVRHYTKELEWNEQRLKNHEVYAKADKRTREGKIYATVKKNRDDVAQCLLDSQISLAKNVAGDEIDDAPLKQIIDDWDLANR